MALVTCHECKKEISSELKKCINCGAKIKLPKKPTSNIVKVFVGVLGAGVIASMILNGGQSATSAQPPKTPQQKAESDKRDAQLQIAGAGAVMLKKSMKDPEAFELKSLLVMPDGAACYEYRAKNGFGATFPGNAILTTQGKMLLKEADGNAFVKAWNKECTVSGGDEIAEVVKRMDII